jgi:hypothetical protein
MSFKVKAYANRTVDFTVTLKTNSGDYLQLQSGDVVRVKVGRVGTVELDLDSAAASANGSSVTVDQLGDGSATHASVTVRLAQGDTNGMRGAYDCEVLVVDDSETSPADAIKAAEIGVIHVLGPLQDGDVGKT